MKRCPQCGREYDLSMSFCLDDGAELLYGPASEPGAAATGLRPDEEPQTAILHETAPPAEAATRAQIHTTEKTTKLPTGSSAAAARPFNKFVVAAPLAVLIVLLTGFLGYRYFSANAQISSIAVMPFVNDTGSADLEYLSDGMTETLIKGLANIPDLNVKPRSTVFRFKGKDADLQTIARELGVQAVLTGRVTQRGDQLTFSLELIDVPNDKVLWTEQYQRRQSEIVSLQSEIAKGVSASIRAKLTGTDEQKVTSTGTIDPEAYQAYLKGRYYWNRRTAENLDKAIEQFKIATDRDPNYALAFAGLADCYAVLSEYAGTPTRESLPQARRFAERAISIDEQLAEPHASLGQVYKNSWQWAEAEKAYKRAIELNPNYPTAYHWYSHLLRNLGRYDEAAAMIKRGYELDPLSSIIGANVAEIYRFQNNHEAAIETSLKIIELDPNFPYAHVNLGLSYLALGRNSEALARLEKAVEVSNRAGFALSNLGYGYAVAGKRTEAAAIAKELEEKFSGKESAGALIAAVYAGLGDRNRAFEWLERAFQNKDDFGFFRWRVHFESLRDDPRFRDLLRRMNLPE